MVLIYSCSLDYFLSLFFLEMNCQRNRNLLAMLVVCAYQNTFYNYEPDVKNLHYHVTATDETYRINQDTLSCAFVSWKCYFLHPLIRSGWTVTAPSHRWIIYSKLELPIFLLQGTEVFVCRWVGAVREFLNVLHSSEFMHGKIKVHFLTFK